MHLVSVFEPLLRHEEKQDAFNECYAAAKAGLECFVLLYERQRRRPYPLPSKN
jgi:hypothetical protein